jgi:hypothetical protein
MCGQVCLYTLATLESYLDPSHSLLLSSHRISNFRLVHTKSTAHRNAGLLPKLFRNNARVQSVVVCVSSMQGDINGQTVKTRCLTRRRHVDGQSRSQG